MSEALELAMRLDGLLAASLSASDPESQLFRMRLARAHALGLIDALEAMIPRPPSRIAE